MITRRTAMLGALALSSCATPAPAHSPHTLFELRNYLLHLGERDTLIELFEREFVESQEAVGAHVVGTFTDLDAPDHFVWLRAFADMATRLSALTRFYSGPVWREHRSAANATMIDSDDVYLLSEMGWRTPLPTERLPVGASVQSPRLYVVDIFAASGAIGVDQFRERAWDDRNVIAAFSTEQSANDFPALPVHADAVLVAIRRYPHVLTPAPIAGLDAPQRRLRLLPTARSLLC